MGKKLCVCVCVRERERQRETEREKERERENWKLKKKAGRNTQIIVSIVNDGKEKAEKKKIHSSMMREEMRQEDKTGEIYSPKSMGKWQ